MKSGIYVSRKSNKQYLVSRFNEISNTVVLTPMIDGSPVCNWQAGTASLDVWATELQYVGEFDFSTSVPYDYTIEPEKIGYYNCETNNEYGDTMIQNCLWNGNRWMIFNGMKVTKWYSK